ncbi:hypothetical protein [Endozoicomonas atrinae]|uniref:hypothetical protein n=1 Tax=Endozoicomonas atrinae TaxID=1333660 RepID=UPI003B008B34
MSIIDKEVTRKFDENGQEYYEMSMPVALLCLAQAVYDQNDSRESREKCRRLVHTMAEAVWDDKNIKLADEVLMLPKIAQKKLHKAFKICKRVQEKLGDAEMHRIIYSVN